MNHEKKYIFVGFSIIFLLIANQVIVHYFLFQKKEDAKLLNLAGRQRMLSQRIHLFTVKGSNDGDKEKYAVISQLLDEWKNSHLVLLRGDKALGISALNEPELIKLAQSNYETIAGIESWIQSSYPLRVEELDYLNHQFEFFLSQMETIVDGIEERTNDKLSFLSFVEAVLGLLVLGVVLLEFRMIILPVFKKIQKSEAILLAKNKELTASQNKLKAILDSTRDINLLISPEYKILNFNKVANEVGIQYFNKPYVLGADIREYYLKEDIEVLEQYMPRVLQGEEFVLEIQREIAGQLVWYELTKKPVYDEKGVIMGASTNLKDVTLRKEKEHLLCESTKQLKASENKLRAVYDSSHDGYVLVSPSYEILSVNEVAQRDSLAIFGKKMEEKASILDFTLPDTKELFLADSRRALQGEFVRTEKLFAGIWFEFNYFPVQTEEEGLIGFSMNVRNIDDRKQVEEYNKALMESIPDKFFVIREDGLILAHQSDAMMPVFDTESILHKPLNEVFPVNVANDFYDAINLSLKNKKVSEVSYAMQVSGEDRYYQAKISFLASDKVIVLSRDVTNIYKQQEEIRKKNQILRGITWQQSHEVRKPIANILGICELINRQLDQKEVLSLELITHIHACAEELDQIVRRIVEQSSDIEET
jgi:PAS domain S-box-containing protein